MSVLPELCPCSVEGEILILFHCEIVKVSSDMLAFGDTKEAFATRMYSLRPKYLHLEVMRMGDE